VTLRNLMRIERSLDCDPFLTARKIRDKFFSLHHLSIRTVQRTIQTTLRYTAFRPAKKPVLTERMMADRMEFCRDYGNWTQDCDGVLFTDETTVRVGVKQGQRVYVRQKKGTNRYEAKYCDRSVRIAEVAGVPETRLYVDMWLQLWIQEILLCMVATWANKDKILVALKISTDPSNNWTTESGAV